MSVKVIGNKVKFSWKCIKNVCICNMTTRQLLMDFLDDNIAVFLSDNLKFCYMNCTVCWCAGEVLPVHIEVSSSSHGKQVEEGLLSVLKKVVSMVSLKDLPDSLSDDQRNRAAVLLKELQAVIVGAQFVCSIQLLTYLSTSEVLESVSAMFLSGQLACLCQQLFRCLTGVDDLTVAISIKAEDLQECQDEFGSAGKMCFQ